MFEHLRSQLPTFLPFQKRDKILCSDDCPSSLSHNQKRQTNETTQPLSYVNSVPSVPEGRNGKRKENSDGKNNLRKHFEDFLDCFVDSVESKRSIAQVQQLRTLRREQDEKVEESCTEKTVEHRQKDSLIEDDDEERRYSNNSFFRNTRLKPVRRLVAIGDLHGDIEKAREAFRVGGLVSSKDDSWCGGDSVAVQVGDQLDRGENELEILHWLERLKIEAREAGGDVKVINGNHEIMAISGDFRYAAPGSFDEFKRAHSAQRLRSFVKRIVLGNDRMINEDKNESLNDFSLTSTSDMRQEELPRYESLRPGGMHTQRFLAINPTVLQIGSTVFAHGGVTPQHVHFGIDRINEEGRLWMLGKESRMPNFYRGRDSVIWTRDFSKNDKDACDCEKLEIALNGLDAQRMVVGHTIQTQGITGACGGKVFRVDVGLSRGCGDGEPEVLEIINDKVVRVLRKTGKPITLNGSDPTTGATPICCNYKKSKL